MTKLRCTLLAATATLAAPLPMVAQAKQPTALLAVDRHWADAPLRRPAAPEGGDPDFVRGPLDAFAWAGMAAHGLRPAAAAEPAVWLRRVALDLTGLPPPADVAATFLADPGPAARAAAVAALLASPRAAERWTAWWLDLARYADSQGYEKDDLRPTMWRYRDWVLAAFAADLPFDRFTVEQLAGDLLPGATAEQRLATAFHRQTMTNTEGGTDDEEFRCAAVVDRVDTTFAVWMGATVGCAQCHDHKFDPISIREYYQLFAFFDQTADRDQPNDAPVLVVPTAAQRAQQKAIELELAELRGRLVVDPGRWQAWLAEQQRSAAAFAAAAPQLGVWHVLGPIRAASLREAHRTAFAPERDGVQLAAPQEGLAWRQALEYSDGTVHTWRADDSAVYLFRTVEAKTAGAAVLALGSDDALRVFWNGVEVHAVEVGRAAAADQEFVPVVLRPGRNELLLKVSNGGGPSGFYFALRPAALSAAACAELAGDGPKARQRLEREFLARDPAAAELRGKIAAAEAAFAAAMGPAVPILQELPAAERRTTRIHRRGSFLDQGPEVTPAVPACWPPLPADAPRNRLGLARWLVSPDNPRTARVLANRIWAELFGSGLVPTLADFGSQGEPPSHPELLDWLASELLAGGWSLRHLLRTIVLSATYGQASTVAPELRERDPHNRWLGRGAALRLPAEAVRDQALATAGLLVEQFGGPSVMPPQPDGIWLQIYSGARWQTDQGLGAWRRSLYTFWRRTSPHPAMLVFDAQSRETCVLTRSRTNTPLQALVGWNEPQLHAAACALGAHAAALQVAETGAEADRQRLGWLWRQALLREPDARELQRLEQLLHDERERGAAASELVASFAPPAHAAVRAFAGPADTAFAVVAAVILNLDEFLTRR